MSIERGWLYAFTGCLDGGRPLPAELRLGAGENPCFSVRLEEEFRRGVERAPDPVPRALRTLGSGTGHWCAEVFTGGGWAPLPRAECAGCWNEARRRLRETEGDLAAFDLPRGKFLVVRGQLGNMYHCQFIRRETSREFGGYLVLRLNAPRIADMRHQEDSVKSVHLLSPPLPLCER